MKFSGRAKQVVIFIVIFYIFMIGYAKYYEQTKIYFPTKEIRFTPQDVSLEYEDVFFETEDGLRLNSWFIPAENPKGIILYNNGNAGNIGDRIEITKIFNKLNLSVFLFDYRGYGKSQGKPSEEGLYRDAMAAYQYLNSRHDIDRDRIILYGESIGAVVAADLASKVNARALIFQSGFSSAVDMGERLFPFLPVRWLITVRYNAVEKLKNLSTPKLIIHSRDDEMIPFELAEKVFNSASEPKEFYIMHGTHNEAIFMSKEEYSKKVGAFIDNVLEQKAI